MTKQATQRVDVRIPESLLKEIEEYQRTQSISNRTTAMLELIRKGLNK